MLPGNISTLENRVDDLKQEVSEWRKIVQEAISVGIQYGQIDGSHHRLWVIDQMIRVLAGSKYDKIINESCNGEDGPDTYEWDCGIAP